MTDKLHLFVDITSEFENEVWAAAGATPADALHTIMTSKKDGYTMHYNSSPHIEDLAACRGIDMGGNHPQDPLLSQVMVWQQCLEHQLTVPVPSANVKQGAIYFYLGDHEDAPLDSLWWGLGFFESTNTQGAE